MTRFVTNRSAVDEFLQTLSSNFGSRPLRFRDIAGFLSQMPLFYIPPRLSPKIMRCSPIELDRWAV